MDLDQICEFIKAKYGEEVFLEFHGVLLSYRVSEKGRKRSELKKTFLKDLDKYLPGVKFNLTIAKAIMHFNKLENDFFASNPLPKRKTIIQQTDRSNVLRLT
jgi:hypothetical protein